MAADVKHIMPGCLLGNPTANMSASMEILPGPGLSLSGGMLTAAAGDYLTASVPNTTASLTNNGIAAVTSISVPAGDWDIEGIGQFNLTAATVSAFLAGISTSNTATTTPNGMATGSPTTLTLAYNLVTPANRFLLSTTTTIYLNVMATFSAGSVTAGGIIRARRFR